MRAKFRMKRASINFWLYNSTHIRSQSFGNAKLSEVTDGKRRHNPYILKSNVEQSFERTNAHHNHILAFLNLLGYAEKSINTEIIIIQNKLS